MEITKLKLYVGADFVSAFAMSAFVALKEKQLSFDLVTVDLKGRENYRQTLSRCVVNVQNSNISS